MKKKKELVLITGGAGFIGSHLSMKLVNLGEKVIILDNLQYSGCIHFLKKYLWDDNFLEPGFSSSLIPYNNPNLGNLPISPKKVSDKKTFISCFEKFVESPNRSLLFVLANLLNLEVLRILVQRVDKIFNLASLTHVDRSYLNPYLFLENDVVGTFTLLEAIRENKENLKIFIHVSTDEVYGEIDKGFFRESSPLNPSNPYSASKAAAENFVRSYFRSFNIPSIIVRPSNTFGPNQHPEKFIPLMIIRALENKYLPIYGDGKQKRSWLYVEDLINALILVSDKGIIGETYNVPGQRELENIEVAVKILSKLGKPMDLIKFVKDRPGHDRRYALDGEKIYSLGFRHGVDFEKGLENTINWYIENFDWAKRKLEESGEFFKKWYGDEFK